MKNVLLILIVFTLTACGNDDDTTTEPTVQTGPILFTNIHQDYLSVNNTTPIIPQSNLVIQTNNEWNNLITQIDPATDTNADIAIAQAVIDFNQESVIMVIRDVMPNFETVEITEVMENVNNITITTVDSNFNNGFQVITQPYHIIMIPKITKPIVFL